MESSQALAALAALAHGMRLSAFRLLVQAGDGGIAAGEIARALNVPANTLSANLAVLAHAGLIDGQRRGRSIIYAARYDAMAALLGYLMEDCCGGNPRICSTLTDAMPRSRCPDEVQ